MTGWPCFIISFSFFNKTYASSSPQLIGVEGLFFLSSLINLRKRCLSKYHQFMPLLYSVLNIMDWSCCWVNVSKSSLIQSRQRLNLAWLVHRHFHLHYLIQSYQFRHSNQLDILMLKFPFFSLKSIFISGQKVLRSCWAVRRPNLKYPWTYECHCDP